MSSSDKIYQTLLKRNYPVMKVHENLTTKTCSHCREKKLKYLKISNAKYIKFLKSEKFVDTDDSFQLFIDKFPESRRKIDSRMCECDNCKKFIHRDVNGARNIAFNLYDFLQIDTVKKLGTPK